MPIKKTLTITKPKKVKEEIIPKIKVAPKKELELKTEEKAAVDDQVKEIEGEIKAGLELVKASKKKYIEAVGRRKTSTAMVRLFTQGDKNFLVNGKPMKDYFPMDFWQKVVEDPLEKLKCQGKFGFSLKVHGGGISGQAEACSHAIARALILLNPYFRKRLKKSGLLTRDSRMRERKKPGLKRARKAPQWSKR